MTSSGDCATTRVMLSWRAGGIVYANHYQQDDISNYLGTYVFSNLAAYEAGQPLLYTRQVGDPSVAYDSRACEMNASPIPRHGA